MLLFYFEIQPADPLLLLLQLSLAVQGRQEALGSIDVLRHALEQAESVTPGFANALAVEVYHLMAEAEEGGEGEE